MPASLASKKMSRKGTVTPQVAPQVTPQVKQLVAALGVEQTQGRDELMIALKRKDRKSFAANCLAPALNNRLVEMTQPNSPNSPTQKYRLTDKGRALLDGAKKTGSKA